MCPPVDLFIIAYNYYYHPLLRRPCRSLRIISILLYLIWRFFVRNSFSLARIVRGASVRVCQLITIVFHMRSVLCLSTDQMLLAWLLPVVVCHESRKTSYDTNKRWCTSTSFKCGVIARANDEPKNKNTEAQRHSG